MNPNAKLARLFHAHWPPPPAADKRTTEGDLERALREALETARAAWPELTLAAELFIPYLAQRAPEEGDPCLALASVKLTDLYLACGTFTVTSVRFGVALPVGSSFESIEFGKCGPQDPTGTALCLDPTGLGPTVDCVAAGPLPPASTRPAGP